MGQDKLKILVLSFYYQPDLCAGSFRMTALVDALRKAIPAGSHIDVVTTLPNRYSSFSAEAPQKEVEEGLVIHRVALPAHRSGMLDQSIAFAAFARGAFRCIRKKEYDLVYATSSRLMTAALGSWIARRKRARLYLDIRDIFVDTIKEVLPSHFSLFTKPLFSALERWTINCADKVNLVSGGFANYFSVRYPGRCFSYFTNGIDDEFLAVAPKAASPVKERGLLTVLYAGNIGEGQGLHGILPELARRMEGRARFRVIGDGGRKMVLKKALERADVRNVELLPPMQRDELIKAYRDADVLFLHLNDYEAFKKVLPSKVFEYGATGKPLWAGISGFSAEFVKAEIENAAVFHPCDSAAAEKALARLILKETPRNEFIEKYARANISKTMAEHIVAVARNDLPFASARESERGAVNV